VRDQNEPCTRKKKEMEIVLSNRPPLHLYVGKNHQSQVRGVVRIKSVWRELGSHDYWPGKKRLLFYLY
jgi:hypothetical protein